MYWVEILTITLLLMVTMNILSDSLYMKTKIVSGVDFRAKNLESIENLEKNSIGLLCIS